MIMTRAGEVETDDEEQSEASTLEGIYDVEYPVEGDLLVTRKALTAHVHEEEQVQRDNIFHTRCYVNGLVCSVIIDGGSCTNVVAQQWWKN